MTRKRATVAYAGFMENAGGVVTHTKLLSRALELRGYEVRVVSLDSIPFFLRYVPHVAWFLLRPLDGILAIYVKQRLARRFLKLVAGADVGNLMVFQDIYIPWQTSATELIVIHALWSDNLQSLRASRFSIDLFSKWEANLLNNTDTSAVTVSRPYRDHIYKYLNKFGLRRKVGVIEPGIDRMPDTVPSPAVQDNAPEGEIRMLYVGALEHRKNIAFLLNVVVELHRQSVPVRLDVVGGGPLSQSLAQMARSLGVAPSVVFHGTLGRDKVAIRMAAANVYVHPSIKESFSFALLEAKFAGLRTVAHAELEVPSEFIDQPVNSWDVAEWASAITRAIKSDAVTFRPENFDLKAFSDRIENHIRTL